MLHPLVTYHPTIWGKSHWLTLSSFCWTRIEVCAHSGELRTHCITCQCISGFLDFISTAYPDRNKLALLNTKLYMNNHTYTHTNLQLTIDSTFLIVRIDTTCTRYKHTSPLVMYICIHNINFEELYKRAVCRLRQCTHQKLVLAYHNGHARDSITTYASNMLNSSYAEQ